MVSIHRFNLTDDDLRRRFRSYLDKEITASELEHEVGGGVLGGPDLARIAFERGSNEELDWLVLMATSFGRLWGLGTLDVSILPQLMAAPWVRTHEDLLQTIADVAPPNIVMHCATVAATASLPYLHAIDECRALKRRSAFVLAGLSTPAAREALEKFAQSPDPALRRYAREACTWRAKRGSGEEAP